MSLIGNTYSVVVADPDPKKNSVKFTQLDSNSDYPWAIYIPKAWIGVGAKKVEVTFKVVE